MFSKKPTPPRIADGVFCCENVSFMFSHKNFTNILEVQNKKNASVFVIGSPIPEKHVDRKTTAKLVLQTPDFAKTVSRLNGEFLILYWNHTKPELKIATDRFSSYPLFWAKNEKEFCLSYNYIDIARYCSKWPGFNLRPEKAFEFFKLQRLMGQETHDNQTRSLSPATILTVGRNGAVKAQSYWQPDYSKNTKSSKKELINSFSQLFEQSVSKRLGSSTQSTGIFLSGGHDSRLVAAYTKPRVTCYTLSFSENNEIACARRIAELCGHKHVFSKLNTDFFEKTIDMSAEISGALYTTDHALFLPESMSPAPREDIFLHGHGLDFMYQGMYLHAKAYRLFNRNTYLKHIVPLPEDLSAHFIDTISFRLKYDIGDHMFNQGEAKIYQDSLYESVNSIYEKSKTLSDNSLDWWENMVFHQPSRHYTFLNVLSKRTCGELRTPSFDNELYDFYLSLPYKYRLHGDIMRVAMFKANAKVALAPTANHTMPAGLGPYAKTAIMMGRKLLRHASLNKAFHGPRGKDRTWPDRDTYFSEHPSYKAMALEPLKDKEFKNFLSFIDWNKLEAMQDQLDQQPFYGAFLVTLLTYYKFYKAIRS